MEHYWPQQHTTATEKSGWIDTKQYTIESLSLKWNRDDCDGCAEVYGFPYDAKNTVNGNIIPLIYSQALFMFND